MAGRGPSAAQQPSPRGTAALQAAVPARVAPSGPRPPARPSYHPALGFPAFPGCPRRVTPSRSPALARHLCLSAFPRPPFSLFSRSLSLLFSLPVRAPLTLPPPRPSPAAPASLPAPSLTPSYWFKSVCSCDFSARPHFVVDFRSASLSACSSRATPIFLSLAYGKVLSPILACILGLLSRCLSSLSHTVPTHR